MYILPCSVVCPLRRVCADSDTTKAAAAAADVAEKGDSDQPDAAAGAAPSATTAVDALFGMATRQRTVCLSGDGAERFTDGRTFQARRGPESHPEGLEPALHIPVPHPWHLAPHLHNIRRCRRHRRPVLRLGKS